MIGGPGAQAPAQKALVLLYQMLVHAGEAATNLTAGIKLPGLAAMGAAPNAAIIAKFGDEAERDAIAVRAPKLGDHPTLRLASPLALYARADLLAPPKEFGAVPPLAVDAVLHDDRFDVP